MELQSKDLIKLINAYIDRFQASEQRRKMVEGEKYYWSENTTINERRMIIYAEEKDSEGNSIPFEIDDPYKSNNQLASGYMKLLVDQKVNYLLGKEFNLESSDNDLLWEIVGNKFQQMVKDVAKEASKKGLGWCHVYIGKDGRFKTEMIPSEQIIPVWNENSELDAVIRYYKIEKFVDGDFEVFDRVEFWDKEKVTYFEALEGTSDYRLLSEDDMTKMLGKAYSNPKGHFQRELLYGDVVGSSESLGWGEVPFIPLHNNYEKNTDLKPVRKYIDAYDVVVSDFMNNLEDFQDVYWILKNYDGENLSEFLYQVKRYKTLKTADDGDARAEKIDVPYEARKEARNALEEDIFKFGMGFNPSMVGDGNVTNVVLRSRFAVLDLKADDFEPLVYGFIESIVGFVNVYCELFRMPTVELMGITFNRSLVVNEVELLEANSKQKGSISETTRLTNHPWVDDAEEEMQLMEDELVAMMGRIDLGDDEEEDDTSEGD